MTKREAIRECKRLWKEIVESGLSKREFLETKAGRKWGAKHYDSNCSLCEYDKQGCDDCPLWLQYGTTCSPLGWSSDPQRFYTYVKDLKE